VKISKNLWIEQDSRTTSRRRPLVHKWCVRAALKFPLALLLSGCTRLFFYPGHDLIDTPALHGIEYREETIRSADGTKLIAWFLPAKRGSTGKAKATILFLHGNAQNISTHYRIAAWLPAEGFNVLIPDYRGYGLSEGSPSLGGMQLDIDAAVQHLLSQPDVDPDRIILLGQSLGGALAIAYAAHSTYRQHFAAIVIDSSFSDYRVITREKMTSFWLTWLFQWVPWLTVDDSFSPAASVANLSPTPLLLIHGDRDSVISYRHSEALFKLAREPKQLWIIRGADHAQALTFKDVRERLVDYFRREIDIRYSPL